MRGSFIRPRWHVATCGIAAALLLCAASSQSRAAEISFPENAPQFSVDVPERWKPVFRDGSLMLLPVPEDGFLIQIHEQPAAAEEALPALTERVASQLSLSNLQIGKPSEAENEQDVECTVLTSRGQADKTQIVITMVAFSIEDERHFTIQSVGAADLNKKHGEALLSVVDSIKPIEQ